MLLELYEKIFRREDIKLQEQKFKLLKEAEGSSSYREAIYESIQNLEFSFASKDYTNIIELMEKGLLEGRDNEATTFLAPFFDEAYLLRGQVELWKTETYPHDWLEINLDGFAFCFDPCFNGLCIRSDYNKIFKPEVKAKIPSTLIRKELIDYLKRQQHAYSKYGVLIAEKMDETRPFYNTYANVLGTVDNGKIKDLKVRFYDK